MARLAPITTTRERPIQSPLLDFGSGVVDRFILLAMNERRFPQETDSSKLPLAGKTVSRGAIEASVTHMVQNMGNTFRVLNFLVFPEMNQENCFCVIL